MRTFARGLFLPVALLALVLTGLSVPAHAAVPDVWAKWNLGDTWIRSLDYVEGGALIAGSETSGVFRKQTVGSAWTDVSTNLSTLGKQVRQTDNVGSTVYIATSAGLFAGNGNGGAWTQLGVDAATPSYQRLDQGGVQAVRFPTNSASYLVVGTSGSGRDGIFHSSDSGKTWTKAGGFTGGAFYLTDTPGSTMYAAGSTGFWKSTDSGKNWTLTSDGIPGGETAKRIAISPVNSNHVIAATVGGVYRSDNGGASWYDASGVPGAQLNVGEVRAFQLVPSTYWNGTIPRIVVGTSNGVWGTSDGGDHWQKLSNTKTGAPGGEIGMQSESVYALTIGFGLPGTLIAGTQGHGVFTLPLQAAEAPGTIAAPSGTTVENKVLTANTGTWSGTSPFSFLFVWKRCNDNTGTSDATCPTIPGATGPTYQLSSSDVGDYIRVLVRARSLVQLGYTDKLSNPTAVVTAPAGPVPTPPGGYPDLTNDASAPWGQTMTVDPSSHPSNWWNANGTPTATTFQYLWDRCDSAGNNCVQLDHSASSYTTTVADVNHKIRARVIGTINGTSSDDRLAGLSGAVYEKKPVNVSPPRIVGRPYVGQVLNSSVGSWTGTSPSFARRWFRCDASGGSCSLLSPLVTTPTYVVKAADRGFTFRVEVKATVVDDFQARVSDPAVTAATPAIGAPLPACSVVVPALAAAKATAVKATKAVKKAKKALKKAKKSGDEAKIKKAKKKLKKAKKKAKAAAATVRTLQAQVALADC